jgi:hypothetical protein
MLQAKKTKAKANQRSYASRRAAWHHLVLQLDKAVEDVIPKLTVMSQPGDSSKDYGNHMLTLNYTEETIVNKPMGVGSIRLGMSYDRDSKALHENQARCQQSRKSINFLLAVRESMFSRLNPAPKGLNWAKFRVNTIVGAQTKPHNDNFRGATPAYLMIHKTHIPTVSVGMFGIRIWMWPEMHTSVVRYKGMYLIPHHYSEARGSFDCIAVASDGKCSYLLFPCNVIKEMEPFGKFDTQFVVCGIKQGKLQVVMNSHYRDYDEFTDIASPKDLPLVSFDAAVEIAANNPQHKRPKDMYKTLTKPGSWHKMFAWRFIHEVVGDPMTPRTHLFFRQIRELCTSSSATPNRCNVHYSCEQKEVGDDMGQL